MSNLIRCPVCGKLVSTGASQCQKCGEPVANFEALIEKKRAKRKATFRWIRRYIILPGLFIPFFNAIAPQAPILVWLFSVPFLLLGWRGLRATEEKPSRIARETAWVLVAIAVFGIVRGVPEWQRSSEMVARNAGPGVQQGSKETAEEWAKRELSRLAEEEEQRKKAKEEECAKMPRSPDAWEKAVADGTLSPKRGEAKFYVQRQLACYPEDEKLIKKLRWMADEEARVIMEEDAARNPQNYLKLETSWRTAADGLVIEADFSIQNTSTIPVRDIAILCNLKAPSGTVVSVNRQTIYDVVKGGVTRSFKNVNMGFINTQASKASCRVESAKAY